MVMTLMRRSKDDLDMNGRKVKEGNSSQCLMIGPKPKVVFEPRRIIATNRDEKKGEAIDSQKYMVGLNWIGVEVSWVENESRTLKGEKKRREERQDLC